MQINLTITGDISPDKLRELLTVAAEFETSAPIPKASNKGPIKGPTELEYLRLSGLKFMKGAPEAGGPQREAYAQQRLTELLLRGAMEAGSTQGATESAASGDAVWEGTEEIAADASLFGDDD